MKQIMKFEYRNQGVRRVSAAIVERVYGDFQTALKWLHMLGW